MSYGIIENGQKNIVAGRVAPIVDRYSTDEVKTDKVWIDGKPIYRNVISIPITANHTSDATYNHNIPNISNIVDLGGRYRGTAGGYIELNTYENTNFYLVTKLTETSVIYRNNGWNNGTIIIILEYTKTTD